MRDTIRQSPQTVDPLSWFGGQQLPLVFALLAVLQGLALTLINWSEWTTPVLQLTALPFFLFAGYLIAESTKPHRAQFGPPQAGVILTVALIGVCVSAAGAFGSSVTVRQWWGSIALAVVLASLAPFSSARHLMFYTVPTAAVTCVVGGVALVLPGQTWPNLGALVIVTAPVLIGGIAASVFSYTVVHNTRKLLRAAEPVADHPHSPADDVRLREIERVARMSGRVAPFLQGIAEAGVITEADRALAGQLARRLRADLVTAVDRSWLDALATEPGLVVSDPDRLADRMNEAQRSALRGLLVAVFESPVVDNHTILIELRDHGDGSTGVALSIDVDLPEGRRLMLLAPHYLTLKSTVRNLSWDDGRSLKLRFRVPAR